MEYVCAEREADFPLHHSAVTEMMLPFFNAKYLNYARYELYYLRSIESMNDEVRNQFIKGEHTFHHQEGFLNRIWSEMGIETTYLRYGTSCQGLIERP